MQPPPRRRPRVRPRRAAGLLLPLLLVSGCGDHRGGSADDEARVAEDCRDRPVRMAVAASLRAVALDLVERVEATQAPIRIEPVIGASSAHARQLALGAPLDLVVSANARIVEDLARDGLVLRDSLREVARGELVLLARPGRFAPTSGLDALAAPGLRRVAIPPEAVPLGHYARAWLARRELLDGLAGRIVTTEHALATLSAVEAGHVDLAIVYGSDARRAREAQLLARIDASEHPGIRYIAARTTRAPRCPTIDVALEAWTSEITRERFAELGFLPPAAPDPV